MAKIDIDLFREKEREKLITCRKHPDSDLVIWNYTAKCQYDNAWNDVTLQARGLVTWPNGDIVARPFKKFFSVEQYKFEIPNEPFKVYEKADGFLGILYFLEGKPYITTRGNFTSVMAQRATQIIQKYQDFPFNPSYTYLFEIIYPEGQIVVDYKGMEDLILLAVIETETGNELDIHSQAWPFPVVKRYDGINDFEEIKAIQESNQEGFVVRFESGIRIKVKFEEYKRLHSLYFHCTARTIWEYLKENKPLTNLLEKVPDELYAWIKSVTQDLSGKHRNTHRKTYETYKEITKNAVIPTPIAIGETLTFQKTEYLRKSMNRYLDDQFKQHPDLYDFLKILHNYSAIHAKSLLHEAIWDSLYPEPTRPSRLEEEEA